MSSARNFAITRASQDKKELLKIAGVFVEESPNPLIIDLHYTPADQTLFAQSNTEGPWSFHFRITIPPLYPFRPPSWMWLKRPPGTAGHCLCLGPNGDVSTPLLNHWSPVSSLANILISLFPSVQIAPQCGRATSHVTLMQVLYLLSRGLKQFMPATLLLWHTFRQELESLVPDLQGNMPVPAASVTSDVQEHCSSAQSAVVDPRVLQCLAEHLIEKEPMSAHVLHMTCRAAAYAVNQAVSKLLINKKHVDIVHAVHSFPCLAQLHCKSCVMHCQAGIDVQPLLQLGACTSVMTSLRALTLNKCAGELLGGDGLLAALRALPRLDDLDLSVGTDVAWALYDNLGKDTHAGNPGPVRIELPPDVPRPVPPEWSCIWVGLGALTGLTRLNITMTDQVRPGWVSAALIATIAFSPRGLGALPALEDLRLQITHCQSGPDALPAAGHSGPPGAAKTQAAPREAQWTLPELRLKSFSISGLALGKRQLNDDTETREFWASLEHLTIRHTVVFDDLKSSAKAMLTKMAVNVKSPDLSGLPNS